MEDDDNIRQEITLFFKSRWTVPIGGPTNFDPSLPLVRVSDQENLGLISYVSEDEIRNALWSMAEDKISSPDGFSPIFFRHFWYIIRANVVVLFRSFFFR